MSVLYSFHWVYINPGKETGDFQKVSVHVREQMLSVNHVVGCERNVWKERMRQKLPLSEKSASALDC